MRSIMRNPYQDYAKFPHDEMMKIWFLINLFSKKLIRTTMFASFLLTSTNLTQFDSIPRTKNTKKLIGTDWDACIL